MTTLVTPAASGPVPEPGYGTAPSLRPGMLPGMIPPDVPVPQRRRGWWRRNAIWLVLLPIAIVVAAGASSFRVWAFWWPVGLHHEVAHLSSGEPAHLADEFTDELGIVMPEQAGTTLRRAIDATVTSVEQVDQLPPPEFGDPVPVPEGAVAYEVRLHFAAEPQTYLSGCKFMLLDDAGTQYGELSTDPLGNSYPCAAADAEDRKLSEQSEWDVTSYMFADRDATITQVLLTLGGPEYVTVDL